MQQRVVDSSQELPDKEIETGKTQECMPRSGKSYFSMVVSLVPWQQMIEFMQISQASLTQGDQKPWVRALCTELHSSNLYKAVEVVLAEGLTVKHQYGRTSEIEPNIRDCSTDNKRMWKRQEVVQKCRGQKLKVHK